MLLVTTIDGLRCYLNSHRQRNASLNLHLADIGLVPTMGALHQGHLSLIQQARRDRHIVVVSIFVNPLQFGPQEDLQKYPRTLSQDLQLCADAGADVVFAPTPLEMGIKPLTSSSPQEINSSGLDSLTQVVPPAEMVSLMCGQFRPGHFQGVATIVIKLLNVVQPTAAYFGAKDAQQVAIIKRLVTDLNLPVEIICCPTVRETSGLAYSSRNKYLTPQQKETAAVLYRSLQKGRMAFITGEKSHTSIIEAVQKELATEPDVQIEYIELVHPDTLTPLDHLADEGLLAIAARVGSTRLIDNLLLQNRQPIIAIDGPAGAGKSTVAREVARILGLQYLDTGAMYRSVTWLVLNSGISPADHVAVAEVVSQCTINFNLLPDDAVNNLNFQQRILINGQDVTQEIRSLDVTAQVSTIAAQPFVRQALLKQQQAYGKKGGLVAEGRDIGTHVFPDAELKIFLTASVAERAKRRQLDLQNQGAKNISLEELQLTIEERDRKDSNREIAPLKQAADAIEVITDGLSVSQVIDRIVSLYREKIGEK